MLITSALGAIMIAQALPAASPDLMTQRRHMLKATRLHAADTFDRQGFLPADQRAAVQRLMGNANQLWVFCLRSGVERRQQDPRPANVIVDEVTRNCAQDREELAAWFRLTARVNYQSDEPSIAQELSKLDVFHRQHMLERVQRSKR